MIDWRLGQPTDDEVSLYSDIVMNLTSNYYCDVLGTELWHGSGSTYADQKIVTIENGFYSTNYLMMPDTLDASSYQIQFGNKDGIFGMSWLPWNVYGIADSDGVYHVKHYYGQTDNVMINPMRKEVLYIKLFTILKLTGITIGTYALIKLMIDLYKRNEK